MKYTNTYTVRTIEMDPEYRIKPYHLCSYAQDTVASWLADMNYASYDLQKQNQSWILTGMHSSFTLDRPKWRTNLNVSIWARKIRGIQFFIDFEISGLQNKDSYNINSQKGTAARSTASATPKVFARGTSSWSIIDEESRRPVRRPDIAERITEVNESACPEVQLRRITAYEGPATTFSQRVHNYDIDFNGHLNSVRYMAGALEAIPVEFRTNHGITSLHIKYNKEAVTGDQLTCSCYSNESHNAFYHHLYNQRAEDAAFMNTTWEKKS